MSTTIRRRQVPTCPAALAALDLGRAGGLHATLPVCLCGPGLDGALFDVRQRVSPVWIREHLQPTEAATWDEADEYIRVEHLDGFPEYWQPLAADIAARGVRRPLIVFAGALNNGHHRRLLAQEAGLPHVPVIVRSRDLRS